jgi:Fe-S-cluster-containing dehydrogenase component
VTQRFFIVDLSKCFGCYGCVAACANVNGTPAGIFWRRLHKLPPVHGSSALRWLPLACNHCENPPCVAACPSNALIKRAEDGVVLHLEERCLGCRYCRMACPFEAISWDAERGLVSKCHFCHERLAEGREPACVETCFAGALTQVVSDGEPGDAAEREVPGFVVEGDVKPSVRFVTGEEAGPSAGKRIFPPPVPKPTKDGSEVGVSESSTTTLPDEE